MTQSNTPEHSKADIIKSALTYQYVVQSFTSSPYGTIVRNRVNALFLQFGAGLQHVHTDSRRSIHEYNGSDFSVQKFEVHSANVPLGNHYHRKGVGSIESSGKDLGQLSEMFVFDEGSGILLLQKLSPDGEVMSTIEQIRISSQAVLVINPLQAHTLYLEPGTKFRGFRPYPFDKDDMDMNSYKLELPIR